MDHSEIPSRRPSRAYTSPYDYTLAPLVQIDSGIIHPDFPLCIGDFWSLTSDQLDSLIDFYHQKQHNPLLTWDYPYYHRTSSSEALFHDWMDLEEKRRQFGRFIGLPTTPWEGLKEAPPSYESVTQNLEKSSNRGKVTAALSNCAYSLAGLLKFISTLVKRIRFFICGFDKTLQKLPTDKSSRYIELYSKIYATPFNIGDSILFRYSPIKCGIFFVFDASDDKEISEAHTRLEALRSIKDMADVPVAVLGVRFATDNYISDIELLHKLRLKSPRMPWYFIPSQKRDEFRPVELFTCSFPHEYDSESPPVICQAVLWMACYYDAS